MSETSAQPYQVAAANTALSTSAEVTLFNDLLRCWQDKLAVNLENENYYHQRIHPRVQEEDEMPEELRSENVTLGWPTKAVDALVNRSVFTGFSANDQAMESELAQLVKVNDLAEIYRQAATSQLICSCAFLTLSRGTKGEPEALFNSYPATCAAGIWDMRRRCLKAGMAVVDTEIINQQTVPTRVNMYTSEATYSMWKAGNRWGCQKIENALGRPLIMALRYRPTLSRPFGQARISNTVKSLTDRALFISHSADVASYFYTWPQRVLAGIDRKTAEKLAANGKMKMWMDKLLLVSTNANGDIPHYSQMSQMTMQPYNDQLQTIAKLFSGETSIPMSSLGISFDNPTSADAMYAAQADLISEAEWMNAANGSVLESLAAMAMASIHGAEVETVEREAGIKARFENPQRPSMSARSDFAIKVNSAVPEFAETPYFWRDLGTAEDDIADVMKAVEIARAKNMLGVMNLPAPIPVGIEGEPNGNDYSESAL